MWVCVSLVEVNSVNSRSDVDACSYFYMSDTDACGGVFNTICTDEGVNLRSCACMPGYTGATLQYLSDDQNTFVGFCTGTRVQALF